MADYNALVLWYIDNITVKSDVMGPRTKATGQKRARNLVPWRNED